MSGEINPIENPQAWDVVIIGGTPSPGYCVVSEFPRKYEWDVKKGKGTVGATSTFVANPPAKGTITFYLWRPEHFVQWDTFRLLFNYDTTKTTAQAFDIYHPSLADVKVKSVVTTDMGTLQHEGKGLWTIKVSLIEYYPAPKKSAVSTPTGSKSSTAKIPGAPPDPIGDAQQAEIARLLKLASQP